MRNRGLLLVLGGALVAGIAVVAFFAQRPPSYQPPSPYVVARAAERNLPVVTVTESQILERVKGMSAIIKRIDRIQAKAPTWGAYLQEQDGTDKVLSDATPLTRPVWVVAVGGEFVPPHLRGATYKWGVMVFDATTGQWLRTDAGLGAWPSFFDQLR